MAGTREDKSQGRTGVEDRTEPSRQRKPPSGGGPAGEEGQWGQPSEERGLGRLVRTSQCCRGVDEVESEAEGAQDTGASSVPRGPSARMPAPTQSRLAGGLLPPTPAACSPGASHPGACLSRSLCISLSPSQLPWQPSHRKACVWNN